MRRSLSTRWVLLALLIAAGAAEARTGAGRGDESTGLAASLMQMSLVGFYLLIALATKRAQPSTRLHARERLPEDRSLWFELSPEHPRPKLTRSLGTPLPLEELRRIDPYFSVPLVLDFLTLLYVRVQLQRGARKLAPLASYVSGDILRRLQDETPPGLSDVSNVLVATAGIVSIEFGPQTCMVVNFLASYVETEGPSHRSYSVTERWTLSRNRNVRSRPPERITSFGCPSCGSHDEPRADGACARCGQVVRDGRFDWFVTEMKLLNRKPAEPPDLSGGQHVGADLPTVFSHTLQDDFRAFKARHPDFDFNHFKMFVAGTFCALKEAWSKGNWERARWIETDNLFSMHRYWIEQYRANGMTNHIDHIRVEQMVGVKFQRDAYYEGITLRLRATANDYTVDARGQVLAGSRDAPCTLSEYWTFIRRIGHHTKAGIGEGCCPNCGAPLHINMAGDCEYCKARLTNGDFGWVVSSIEAAGRYGG